MQPFAWSGNRPSLNSGGRADVTSYLSCDSSLNDGGERGWGRAVAITVCTWGHVFCCVSGHYVIQWPIEMFTPEIFLISHLIICLWPQSILRGGVIIPISFNGKKTKIKLMSHSTVFLTCNCSIASILTCGAIYGRRDEAGTQNKRITGFTGEGLNCGRGHNKWLKTVKQSALQSE